MHMHNTIGDHDVWILDDAGIDIAIVACCDNRDVDCLKGGGRSGACVQFTVVLKLIAV